MVGVYFEHLLAYCRRELSAGRLQGGSTRAWLFKVKYSKDVSETEVAPDRTISSRVLKWR
jgi:hypothetical protein